MCQASNCTGNSTMKSELQALEFYNKKKYKLVELWNCIEAIEGEVITAVQQGKYKTDKDVLNLLLNALAKSIVTIREIIILCGNGYPDGALGLARNLYEQFIIISYLHYRPENSDLKKMVEMYFDDYDIRRNQYFLRIAEISGNKEEENALKEKEKEFCDKYNNAKIKNPYWWSKHSGFLKICKYLSSNIEKDVRPLLTRMHSFYERANVVLHAGAAGNVLRMGSSIEAIDTGPWIKGQEGSLYLSVVSFLLVAGYTYNNLNLNYDSKKNKLNDFANYYRSLCKVV